MGKTTSLAAEQLRALDRLKTIPGLASFYLAGGSAVALHLGHRLSLDLDLFSLTRDVNLEEVAAAAAVSMPDFRVLALSDVCLRAVVGGIAVDIVRYPYPPLAPPAVVDPLEFPVASLRDLAAMKLAAIARRGLRRDFWDLFAICTSGHPLAEACDAYLARFGRSQPDLYHVLRALTYFADAEKEEVLPAGMTEQMWGEVKKFFTSEAPKLLR
ncbi:MAG: nucleotidyl transferase AbiEii/AbiGii toxin family protein [Candidatus Schekmanbacteria bacterium]|nr:nucleotidyl transferase AbiEii/AbiGii toxin family protein [Candidatus Schekmanbacteria bacterium]